MLNIMYSYFLSIFWLISLEIGSSCLIKFSYSFSLAKISYGSSSNECITRSWASLIQGFVFLFILSPVFS